MATGNIPIPSTNFPNAPQPTTPDFSGAAQMGAAADNAVVKGVGLVLDLKQQMNANDLSNAITAYRQRMNDALRDLQNNPRQKTENLERRTRANPDGTRVREPLTGDPAEPTEATEEFFESTNTYYNNYERLVELRDEAIADISENLLRSGSTRRQFMRYVERQRIEEDDRVKQFDVAMNRELMVDNLIENVDAMEEAGDLSGGLEILRMARDEMGIIEQKQFDDLADALSDNVAWRNYKQTYLTLLHEEGYDAAWDILQADDLEYQTHDGQTRNLSLKQKEELQSMLRSENEFSRERSIREANAKLFEVHDELFDAFDLVETGQMSVENFKDFLLNDDRAKPFDGMRMDIQDYWMRRLERLQDRWRRADDEDGAIAVDKRISDTIRAYQNDRSITDAEYQRVIAEMEAAPENAGIPQSYWQEQKKYTPETDPAVDNARKSIADRLTALARSQTDEDERDRILDMIEQAQLEFDETMYQTGPGQIGHDVADPGKVTNRIESAEKIANSIIDQVENQWVATLVADTMGRDTLAAIDRAVVNPVSTYMAKVATGRAWSSRDDNPDAFGALERTLGRHIITQTGTAPARREAWEDGGIDFFYAADVTDRNNTVLDQYIKGGEVRFRYRNADPTNPRSRVVLWVRRPHDPARPWVRASEIPMGEFSFVTRDFNPTEPPPWSSLDAPPGHPGGSGRPTGRIDTPQPAAPPTRPPGSGRPTGPIPEPPPAPQPEDLAGEDLQMLRMLNNR